MEKMDLQQIRQEYSKHELDETAVDPNPLKQFETWMAQALESKVKEPTATTLATVDPANKPHTRIVLLKGYDESGLTFFTNHASDKGQEIEANPNVSLCFFWIELERQVRIDGIARKLPREEAEAYFKIRPHMSQIGAWASNQSEVVENRAYLDQKFESYLAKFPEGEVPMPETWGGYKITPNFYEFWQGRRSRLHDRIAFYLNDGSWAIKRLSP